MPIKKTLTSIIFAGAFIAAFGLNGCAIDDAKKYETGTVVKETSTTAPTGYPAYILEIKTSDSTYTAVVKEGKNKLSVRELASAIEEGDTIKFVIEDPHVYDGRQFGVDKHGLLLTDQIEILKKGKGIK